MSDDYDYSLIACHRRTLADCEAACRSTHMIATCYPEHLSKEQWQQIADAKDWLDAIYRKLERERQIQEQAA